MAGNRKRRSGAGRLAIVALLLFLGAAGWAAIRWLRPLPDGPPAPAGEAGPGAAASPASGASPAELTLHFSTPDGEALGEERRTVPLPDDTLERCRAIVEELKKGPRGKTAPLVPVDLELRSIFLVDTVLVIDLQPRVREASMGALQEELLWYSVVNSLILGNRDKVTAVHFLVDGAEADAILGHLDMRGAFRERPELVRREGEGT